MLDALNRKRRDGIVKTLLEVLPPSILSSSVPGIPWKFLRKGRGGILEEIEQEEDHILPILATMPRNRPWR